MAKTKKVKKSKKPNTFLTDVIIPAAKRKEERKKIRADKSGALCEVLENSCLLDSTDLEHFSSTLGKMSLKDLEIFQRLMLNAQQLSA